MDRRGFFRFLGLAPVAAVAISAGGATPAARPYLTRDDVLKREGWTFEDRCLMALKDAKRRGGDFAI